MELYINTTQSPPTNNVTLHHEDMVISGKKQNHCQILGPNTDVTLSEAKYFVGYGMLIM
jgi:hypothetical protein